MIINYTDKKRLEDFMAHNLKPKRYQHSLGVEQMAIRLAKTYGIDEEKAAFAGRYHDIAKCFSDELSNRYVREYGLPEELLYNNPLAHSKNAAAILHSEFGVNDKDVLNAVAYHTTGRAGMSLLEEIIYVSDAIEETRSYPELSRLQKDAFIDLHGVCLFIMDYTIALISDNGRVLDNDTLEARLYISNKENL